MEFHTTICNDCLLAYAGYSDKELGYKAPELNYQYCANLSMEGELSDSYCGNCGDGRCGNRFEVILSDD